MPSEVKQKLDVTDSIHSNLFFEEIKEIHQTVATRLNAIEEQSYAWLDEILQIAKKAFREDETCLLPKTPSAKRKARGRQKRTSNKVSPRRNLLESSQNEPKGNKKSKPSKGAKKRDKSEVSMSEDEDFDTPANKVLLVEESDDDQPVRSTRATRANSRTAATTSRAKNTRNANKNTKNKKNKSEGLIKNLETTLNGMITADNRDSFDSGGTAKIRLSTRSQYDNKQPEILTKSSTSQAETLGASSTPKSDTRIKECSVLVKEWVQSISCSTIALNHEKEIDRSVAPNKLPKTPIQNFGQMNVKEKVQAYEDIGIISPVHENKTKKRSNNIQKTPENVIPATDVLIQKTLDTNVTKEACTTDEPRSALIYEESVYEELHGVGPAIPGTDELPSEKKAASRMSMTRTRASLKLLPSKQREIGLHGSQQVEEQPARTRTRLRLKKKDKDLEADDDDSSVSSTGKMEVERAEIVSSDQGSFTESYNMGNQPAAGIKTSTPRAKDTESSDSKDDVPSSEEESVPRKLRSSQDGSINANPNKEFGMGGNCGLSGDELPRATRSKIRKPKVSDEEMEEPKTTRSKTRKRQLDEDEVVRAQPKRSRSYLNEKKADEGTATTTNMNSSSDKSSDEFASPPCPRSKIVRPHPKSFLNKFKPLSTTLNTTPLKSAQINPGLSRSFIRTTPIKKPTLKEIQEKKKKDLLEKAKKQEELQKKREEEHKKKMEELRKRREEKMRKVQECRELKAKQEKETRLNMEKKMAEKRNVTSKLREEKLKEEKERQKLRLQKFEDAEDRRKREEEERRKRLQEQLEHEKIQCESMQRKKEVEEQERHRKMEEERQRAVERQHELEKERERERERLAQIKACEDEKKNQWLKKKEERDRLIAKEKLEREKYELEKKKERDIMLKKEMERIREQDKLRHAEEEKIRMQQKKQEMELKKMVDKHNAQVQNQQNALPKPNLNKPHSLNEQTANKNNSKNDSYEMTPDRVHKPATAENYCIDDMKSDDETDDEDAPRKKVPDWAQGSQLKAILIKQHLHPPNLDLIFDVIEPPDLNKMFAKKRERFNKRTSSAHWDEPILKPGLLGRT